MSKTLAWLAGLIVCLAFLAMMAPAFAHDSWISHGGYKNNAGEWCCGDYDCKSLDYDKVKSTANGWLVEGELVPFDESIRINGKDVVPPDGKLTICRRPDGSRRCVFGLKPGT